MNFLLVYEGGFHRRHYTVISDGGKCWGATSVDVYDIALRQFFFEFCNLPISYPDIATDKEKF